MFEMSLNDLVDILDEYFDDAYVQGRSMLGLVAEDCFAPKYLSALRTGSPGWYTLQQRDRVDWRDTSSLRADDPEKSSILEFIADQHNGTTLDQLKKAFPKNISQPDIISLAELREWYEIKPAIQRTKTQKLVWLVSKKSSKSYKKKRDQVEKICSKFGLPEIKPGTQIFSNYASEIEVRPTPDPDELILDDLKDFFENPTDLDVESVKTVFGLLKEVTALTAFKNGYIFRFKRAEKFPGLILWDLVEDGDRRKDFDLIKDRIRVPVPGGILTEEQKKQHQKNDSLFDEHPILVGGLIVLGVVGIAWLLYIAAVAALASLSALAAAAAALFWATAATAAPNDSGIASQRVFGVKVTFVPSSAPLTTFATSIGPSGVNDIRDVQYVQTLINAWLKSKGKSTLAVTGRCDNTTWVAIQDFASTEASIQNLESLRPQSLVSGLLHVRFLEILCLGSVASEHPVLQKLIVPPPEQQPHATYVQPIYKAVRRLFEAIYSSRPEGTVVPVPEPTPEEQKWGVPSTALRLCQELKALQNSGGDCPSNSTIYQTLDARIQPHLDIVAAIRQDADVVPRTEWGVRTWPDMKKDVSFDWRYTTIVFHHTGNSWFSTTDTPQAVEELHLKKEGYADIGYHYIVDRGGRIHEGRNLIFKGSHVLLANTGKIGVAVCGDFVDQLLDFSDDEIAPLQIASARKLVSVLRDKFGALELKAHNEINPGHTPCPGRLKDVIPQLG